MSFVYGLLHTLQQVISFPANLMIWIWSQPKRGRCFVWGMPAVLTLLLVLLISVWTRTSLTSELTRSYETAKKLNESEIKKLEKTVSLVTPANRQEPNNGGSNVVIKDDMEGDASAGETQTDRFAKAAVQEIRKHIDLPVASDGSETKKVAYRISLEPDGTIGSQIQLISPSGDTRWDDQIKSAILGTKRLFESFRGDIPDSLDLTFDLRQLMIDKHLAESQIYLRKLIELNPNDAEYKFELAKNLFEEGRTDQAVALMTQIAPNDKPGYAPAHVWQAMYIFKNKDVDVPYQTRVAEVNKQLNLALQADPNNFDASYGLAELNMRQGKYKEAIGYLEKLFADKANLRSLNVSTMLINAYLATGEMQKFKDRATEIEKRLKAFWKDDPDSDVYLFDLVRIYDLTQRYEEAIELLKQNVNDKNSKIVNHFLGDEYVRWAQYLASQNKEFFDKLEQAKTYDPNNGMLLIMLTQLGLVENPFQQRALQLYDPQADLDAAPAYILRDIASYLISQNKADQAIEILEQSYKKNAKDPVTNNNLAYLMLTKADPDPARALTLANDAIRYIPNSGNPTALNQLRSNVCDTKAAALMQLGKFKDAIPFFQAALSVRPKDIKILTSLRDCYKQIHLQDFVDKYQREIDEAQKAQSNPKNEKQ